MGEKPKGLNWTRWGLEYLGDVLEDKADVKKNLEGLLDEVKGQLAMWKGLVPNISYSIWGFNVVASSLWHKMSCLDPL